MFFSENISPPQLAYILHTFSVLFLTHFQGHVQKKGIANDRMIVRNFLSHPSLNNQSDSRFHCNYSLLSEGQVLKEPAKMLVRLLFAKHSPENVNFRG